MLRLLTIVVALCVPTVANAGWFSFAVGYAIASDGKTITRDDGQVIVMSASNSIPCETPNEIEQVCIFNKPIVGAQFKRKICTNSWNQDIPCEHAHSSRRDYVYTYQELQRFRGASGEILLVSLPRGSRAPYNYYLVFVPKEE